MAWYNSNWSYRIPVTIDSTKVSADLTDFPVYVDLAYLGADFFSNVKTDGSDIRITKDDGTTEVPREVVSIDTSGSTGELHFKADGTLSSSTDTDFYIYYGNASATEPAVTATYGRNNVWDTNYLGVWHLEETPNASAYDVVDSTGNNFDMRAAGTTPTSASGQLGKGVQFAGGRLYSNATWQANQPITMEAWIYLTSTGNQTVFGTGADSLANRRNLLMFGGTKIQHTEVGGDVRQNGSIAINNWHYVCTTKDAAGGAGSVTLYANGNIEASTLLNPSYPPSTTTGATNSIFLGTNVSGTEALSGIIDEARFSTTERSSDWISTQYNNQNSASTFYSAGAQEEAPPIPWYNSSWTYRQKITIDSTKVSADLTDFPVYVDLADLGADFFSNVKTDGSDIRITKSDGTTEVPREVVDIQIVSINPALSTGELHFKADGTLSSSTDTDFYIYYGNASATEPAVTATYGRNSVWDSVYSRVFHLGTDPTSSIIDSVGTGNNLTAAGGMTSSDLVSGQIDKSIDFDGSNDYLVGSDSGLPTGTAARTLSMWLKHSSSDSVSWDGFCGYGIKSSKQAWYPGFNNAGLDVLIGTYGGNSGDTTFTLTNNVWEHLAVKSSGSSVTFIKNGTTTETVAGPSGYNTALAGVSGLQIGWNWASQFFGGSIDEVRIAASELTNDWVSTEYNNQNSASTFYSAGAQETYTPSATFIPKITSVL